MSPEEKAREEIDRLLTAAGWTVADVAQANLQAGPGVAIREFPLNAGFGFADYLLYVDGKAASVIEAKKQGATQTGADVQSGRGSHELIRTSPTWYRALPFPCESAGLETHFTSECLRRSAL